MELKHTQPTSVIIQFLTFNRTSMELKLTKRRGRVGGLQAFNRTSMELKPTSAGVPTKSTGLLIEPVWN